MKPAMDARKRMEPDLALFMALFVLAGIGVAMIYSASAVNAMKIYGDSFYFLKKQVLWVIIGFIMLIVIQQVDYRKLQDYTMVMILGSLILLVLVLIPGVGHNVKGSARWLHMGSVSIQPSEFVKIVIIIYIAKMFSSEKNEGHLVRFLVPLIIVAVVFMLIMMQPDFGTSIDLLIVSVFMLFISGFPLVYILFLFIISIPMFYLLIYQVTYRRERILAYLNPWNDRYGIGYHIIQSFIAFKKGGFLGAGLGNGTQKIARLPEPHTDFIFAVVAEETGVIGTVLIAFLFFIVFWKGMEISLNAPDRFGMLLGAGLSLMIAVQAYINIAVVCGILPTTGLPLPFISYGGSSLITNMVAGGIILNISRYSGAVDKGISLEGGIREWLS